MDLAWLELELCCYARRITPEMSAYELRQALKHLPGAHELTISLSADGTQLVNLGDKTLEIGPLASNDEIILALQNPFIRTEHTRMSISGYEPGAIKAKLDALKKSGKDRRDQALIKLDAAGRKHEAVSDEIERVAGQIEKEADAAIAEFAEFSNGGPV
jgi:hypothetical protein